MRPFFSTLWRFYDYRSIMVFRLFRVGSGFGLGGYRRLERLIMKKRILILLMAALFSSQSMSAALPAYSPKFGNAMAGVVQQKVAARGFAANDPRFIATEAAIGTVLTGAATGLAVAAGAPLWATIAVGAVASAAVSIGIDALTRWLFNSDGTVTAQTVMPNYGTGGSTQGGGYFGSNDGTQFADAIAAANHNLAIMRAAGPNYYLGSPFATAISGCTPVDGGGFSTCSYPGWYNFRNQWIPPEVMVVRWYSSGAGGTCPAGQGWKSDSGCVAIDSGAVPVASTPKKISDAVADVPDVDMAKSANPDLVAQAVNDAWRKAAAQPGYQGIPYVTADPVTAQDVSNWKQSNPDTYPTVGDMLSPAVNPATSTVPAPVAPGSQVQPNVNPGVQTGAPGQPTGNFGVDPVIGFPTLEAIPTAQSILNPVLGLLPSFKNFVVPSHSAVCPKPSITLFNKYMVMDGHCLLLDNVRPTLYSIMFAVWLMIALFIILAA